MLKSLCLLPGFRFQMASSFGCSRAIIPCQAMAARDIGLARPSGSQSFDTTCLLRLAYRSYHCNFSIIYHQWIFIVTIREWMTRFCALTPLLFDPLKLSPLQVPLWSN